METVVDFHSHLLPGVDDGSASLEESLAMLRMEAEQGIRQVVATPHFYAQHDTPQAFLERRAKAVAQLREAMAGIPNLPQVCVGAEVYYFPGMGSSKVLSELTIENSGYILIEMPIGSWTSKMYEDLEQIHTHRGLIPIIAHVDRYIRPFHTRGIPEKLMDLPVLVQANASFFQKFSTKAMALKMLAEDQIHLLGSDCHNLNDRTVNLRPAIDLVVHKLGSDAIRRINSYEHEVLSDGIVSFI